MIVNNSPKAHQSVYTLVSYLKRRRKRTENEPLWSLNLSKDAHEWSFK